MNRTKWDFELSLSPHAGASIYDTFEDLLQLKEMGIANATTRIDFNGTDLIAGIYENGEQFLNTNLAVKAGDKQKVLENLPQDAFWLEISVALDFVNRELKKRDFEVFSDEQIDEICSEYKKRNDAEVSRSK